jgi:tetratricopeptide (TPR) repeat protein
MFTAEPASHEFHLPDVPERLQDSGAVAVWEEPVVIPTYLPGEASRYPQYLDQRVYQGSSGRVYPMPFIESIAAEPVDRQWRAIHMVTDYVRLMILPELGGRIYHAEDLTRGYDFFYRNNVLKPALVGLLGPWISGGVEFNWPQHHRPASFLPTATQIEHEDDGAVTVWCSDLDPFDRMKGMHGVRLRPGSSLIELRVRLHNRTADTRTFLWWANVAAPVGDHYQSFFPTDVHYVADHAKRAVTGFPRATVPYYGIDYSARADSDHPDADRIDWYRNIPVPTSYMCLGSQDDFFGGYDHQRRAGFVHVADHRIAPGKKQWTWGNERFGWAWDRNLTDGDGPYVELMAGVYTDNQPDFAFLAPGETKTFSQFWYPIQDIGCATQANTDVAVRFAVDEADPCGLVVAVASSRVVRDARVVVREKASGSVVLSESARLAPGKPILRRAAAPGGTALHDLVLEIDEGDRAVLTWNPRPEPDPGTIELPEPAFESPAPKDIASSDELYLAGLHLAQYRHATRRPEVYWEEALRRDPGDYRVNVAMARLKLRRGLLEQAEAHARAAVERLTWRNPNPLDSEAYYVLGLVLTTRGRAQEAYDAFAKAAWSSAWKAASWEQMARIDLAGRRDGMARANLESALRLDADNLEVRNLLAIAFKRTGAVGRAEELLTQTRTLDPLDPWTRFALDGVLVGDAQVGIDIALELASAGEFDDALAALDLADAAVGSLPTGEDNPSPLIAYHRWDILTRAGRSEEAAGALADARERDVSRAFPGRLSDALVLERAARKGGGPAAWALLGDWLYAHDRRRDAIDAWTRGPQDDPVVLRNLGVGAVNVTGDLDAAREHYERAIALAPDDERLLYERDQLAARAGESVSSRIARLEAARGPVGRRSDLSATLAQLLALSGRLEESEAILTGQAFQPWEGGEGMVLAAWETLKKARAEQALAAGNPAEAVRQVREALTPPRNLGEDRHLLANRSDLDLLLGDALMGDGQEASAREAWRRAAESGGDFVSMAPTEFSSKTVYSARALLRLGRGDDARRLLDRLREHARQMRREPAAIDYFATSLPTMLLFHEDIEETRNRAAGLMEAQALAGLGEAGKARALLASVLAADPANVRALELAGELDV